MVEYDSNGNYLRQSKFDGTKTIGTNTAYIRGHIKSPLSVKVTNITTNKVIFDWIA
jgi:hypothetical protein